MTKFERCQQFVLEWEGGLTDDAADSGGQAVFKAQTVQ